MKGYPRRFLPGLVATFMALAVSGFLLVPTALEFRLGFDVAWRLPGDERLWVAALHSALSLAMCVFAGALWTIHIRVGWRSRRHLLSGLTTIAVLIAAAVTAIGLLYFGDESWLLSASVGHTVVGTLSVAAAGIHWTATLVERARRRADQEPVRYPSTDPRATTHLVTD